MPDELDPTTARLVSELAAAMLPTLTRSLSQAIPANDFSGALDRVNKTSQDMRIQIEKAIRSGIDDNRAARSMIMQSLGNLLEEIASMKRSVDRMPDSIKHEPDNTEIYTIGHDEETSQKLDEISGLLHELIKGLSSFSEVYTEKRQAEASSDAPYVTMTDNPSMDRMLAAIPALEGLVRAEGKTHSHELEEFSREISAMHEQNNIALIHEVKETAGQEFKTYAEDMMSQIESGRDDNINIISKMFRTIVILSGVNIFLMVAMTIIILLKG